MKLVLFFLLNFLAGLSYGQITIGPTMPLKSTNPNYSTDLELTIFPYQRASLDIIVKNKDHSVFVTDDTGKIVYRQGPGKGNFTLVTGSNYKNFIIYDDVSGKHELSTKNNGEIFNIQFTFGNDDATVNVVDKPIPGHLDTLNKQFVRFLLIDAPVGFSNFSVSLEKISYPTILTEPMMSGAGDSERNFIVGKNVYEKFKKYFLNKKYYLKTDTAGVGSRIFLEIDIDYKHRYYVNIENSVYLLNDFKTYLSRQKGFELILNQLDRMISDLEYIEHREPNGDPD